MILRYLLLGVATELRIRVRGAAFLITVLVGGLLCFSIAAGDVAVSWGGYRGAPSGGWIGTNGAVVTLLLLSLAGFFLVRNGIQRDRAHGFDAAVGASPVSPLAYIVVKAAGNAAYLLLLLVLPMLMVAAALLVRAPHAILPDVLAAWRPFALLVMPVLAGIAGVALLFDLVPMLSGAAGSVVYFFLWCFLVAASNRSHAGGPDLLGLQAIKPLIQGAVAAAHPGATGFFDIGVHAARGTFLWPELPGTGPFVWQRLLWALPLLAPVAAAPWFQVAGRAPASRGRAGRIQRWTAAMNAGLTRIEVMGRMPEASLGRSVLGELAVGLKAQSGWWAVGAVWIVVMTVVAPLESARAAWYPLAALWALPVLSGLGSRELRAHTAPMLHAVERPVVRQLGAATLSGGVVVAALLGGFALRAALASAPVPALGAAAAMIGLPACAVGLGSALGGNRPFELLFTLAWYLGPVRGSEPLDFLGRTPGAAWEAALLLGVGLLPAGFLVRGRQLRHGKLV